MKNRGIVKFNFTAVELMKVGICTGAIKLGMHAGVCVCVKGIGQGRLTPNLNAAVSPGIHIRLHFVSPPGELFCVCVFGEHLTVRDSRTGAEHSRELLGFCFFVFFPNPAQKSACLRLRFSQRSKCAPNFHPVLDFEHAHAAARARER